MWDKIIMVGPRMRKKGKRGKRKVRNKKVEITGEKYQADRREYSHVNR